VRMRGTVVLAAGFSARAQIWHDRISIEDSDSGRDAGQLFACGSSSCSPPPNWQKCGTGPHPGTILPTVTSSVVSMKAIAPGAKPNSMPNACVANATVPVIPEQRPRPRTARTTGQQSRRRRPRPSRGRPTRRRAHTSRQTLDGSRLCAAGLAGEAGLPCHVTRSRTISPNLPSPVLRQAQRLASPRPPARSTRSSSDVREPVGQKQQQAEPTAHQPTGQAARPPHPRRPGCLGATSAGRASECATSNDQIRRNDQWGRTPTDQSPTFREAVRARACQPGPATTFRLLFPQDLPNCPQDLPNCAAPSRSVRRHRRRPSARRFYAQQLFALRTREISDTRSVAVPRRRRPRPSSGRPARRRAELSRSVPARRARAAAGIPCDVTQSRTINPDLPDAPAQASRHLPVQHRPARPARKSPRQRSPDPRWATSSGTSSPTRSSRSASS
jgi:hypothetical protein